MAYNNQNANTNKDGRLKRMFKEGSVLSQFTKKYLVKVYPRFEIDKMKFSFAYIGQHGAGFDIHMDTTVFDMWCEDIQSGSMFNRLKAEAQATAKGTKFNAKYDYSTGENGSKHIKIQQGKNSGFVAIYGSVINKAGKQEYMVLPVSYMDLKIMAMLYKRVSEPYWNDVAKVILEASTKYNDKTGNVPVKDTTLPVSQGIPTAEQDDVDYATPVFDIDAAGTGLDISNDDLPF